MKFSLSLAAIGLFLFPAVSASILNPKNILRVGKALKRNGDPKMFPDVQLPKSLSWHDRIDNLLELQSKTNFDVFLTTFLPMIVPNLEIPPALAILDTQIDLSVLVEEEKPGKEEAQPRSEEFRKIYSQVINRYIRTNIDDPQPVEGYLYFGNRDHTKILPMLCQVNPFWASALTAGGDNDEYLELNAYHHGSSPSPDSKYLTIVSAMIPDPARRINVRFNKDMTVNQIITYESGEAVIVPEEEWNYYASGVCYNMLYYTQNIHALIHVLHYLMTTGITHCTDHDDALSAWSSPYDDNIAMKYYQVAFLLFESSIGSSDDKVLTGKFGLGGTKSVMKPLRDYLCIWGECKNAEDFKKKFLLKDLYATAKNPEELIKTADILTEFNKHLDNIDPFATELSDAMKANNARSFKDAEDRLTKFMSECGRDVSSIDSISSWVQLMSCTGIIHGSTLSYSRMSVMPEIMRWRDIKSPKWSREDTATMSGIIATIQGMTEDRHVFTSEIQSGKKWDTNPISKGVQDVLDKYNLKANKLKTEYQKAIEKREDFREFGWILTDHCIDGYDGKQHTIATYI